MSQPRTDTGEPLRKALGKLLGRHHRAMLVNREHCAACDNYQPTFAEVAALAESEHPPLDVERLRNAIHWSGMVLADQVTGRPVDDAEKVLLRYLASQSSGQPAEGEG